MDLLVIGCVSQKLDHAAPAKDLYTSELWRKRRAYAERAGAPWMILSALYGLLDPAAVVDTYNVDIGGLSKDASESWGRAVVRSLRVRLGELEGKTIEIHAGSQYLKPIETHLRLEGARILLPLRGLSIGQQLAWYINDRNGSPKDSPPESSDPMPRSRLASTLPFERLPLGRKQAVAAKLLAHDSDRGRPLRRGRLSLVPTHPQADEFVHENAFAFLLAVIFDQGIGYERAWQAPLELQSRLGHLDPARMIAEPEAISAAISRSPALHRYVNKLPRWVLAAARRVVDEFGGDAGQIWCGDLPARKIAQRLETFLGISQKKAAMSVMLLWRHLDVEVKELSGIDLAVDIHVRRVFLRAGLVERDVGADMINMARQLNPSLPGALDSPAWDIGRLWCRPQVPNCSQCPLIDACPKLVDRAVEIDRP